MFFTLSKKIALVFITTSIIALSVFFISCQKEFSGDGIDLGDTLPDLSTKIAASVAGFVTDENEVAVNGATVVFGSSTTATDKFGYFEVRNVQVTQIAAVVTVLKPGYFKGIKTYIATAGKSAFFRIKLLPKTTAGNIDAAAGGSATLANGLSISLPAGALVNSSNNAAYTGSVTVAAQWLNPTADDLYRIMPGDLRGLDSLNYMRLLTTYGMSAVELTGTSGELLQIAAGKKATLNFPLPTAVAGTAPASIPLWYFDETKGLWKQEGNALKSGNNYVGEVSHFSYWNCDMPIEKSIQFSCTIVDGNGNPMPNVSVWIEYANGDYTGAHGFTDSTGYLNGLIPANADLVLKIYTDYQCSGPVYTQLVTTGTTTLSLGNITVGPTSTATIMGNVTDCNNAPVTNGYVIFQYGYYNVRAVINGNGTFSLNTIICSSNTSVNIIATDNSSLQQSSLVNRSIQSGINNLGTLNACGTSIEEFINYSVNGVNYAITAPVDKLYGAVNPQNSQIGVYIQGNADSSGFSGNSVAMIFEAAGIAVNSTQNLTSFNTRQINDSSNIVTPILVNITEYGGVGEFIAGNFTGTVTGATPANTPYNITCNFRVKRSQ
jgi:hypothetical protein